MLTKTYLSIFGLAAAAIVPSTNSRSPEDESREKWHGLNWSEADITCSQEQIGALERTTVVALHDMLNPTYFQLPTNNQHWNRFFMNDNEADNGHGWNRGVPLEDPKARAYSRIINNLRYPYYYILLGWTGGIGPSVDQQTSALRYSCADSLVDELCVEESNRAAYTLSPDQSPGGTWTITFCPEFFQLPHIEDKGRSTDHELTPQDLNDMRTREQELIREFFHVDLMGFVVDGNPDFPHIDDMRYTFDSDDGEVAVEGAYLCHRYAWANVGTYSPKSVNPGVSVNSDSYAYYFTSIWMARAHDWSQYSGENDVIPGGRPVATEM